jgi:hypothetical protein
LAIVLSVLLSLSFGHCFVCSSVFIFWPLFCLFFCLYLLAFVLSVLRFTANNYPFGTFKLLKITKNACLTSFALYSEERDRRGRGRMGVGFTTTYVIGAYHH